MKHFRDVVFKPSPGCSINVMLCRSRSPWRIEIPQPWGTLVVQDTQSTAWSSVVEAQGLSTCEDETAAVVFAQLRGGYE